MSEISKENSKDILHIYILQNCEHHHIVLAHYCVTSVSQIAFFYHSYICTHRKS